MAVAGDILPPDITEIAAAFSLKENRPDLWRKTEIGKIAESIEPAKERFHLARFALRAAVGTEVWVVFCLVMFVVAGVLSGRRVVENARHQAAAEARVATDEARAIAASSAERASQAPRGWFSAACAT